MSRLIAACFVALLTVNLASAVVTVTAESDKNSIRVGERIEVTVHAIWPDSPTEAAPSHAGLQLGPEWGAGAQTVESEHADSTGLVKTWHFELSALAETTSTITPVVILADPAPGAPPLATNRVLGASLTVTILPAKVRPWWLPRPRTIALIFALATAVFTILAALRRRRRNKPRPIRTPFQDATAMMEEVHANCRIDRAPRFFADVERVLTGYLSRRTGRSLGSATAPEVARLAAEHVHDALTISDLQTILQRCTTARFSGAKVDFPVLAQTEEMTLSVLERLEAAWVTDTPSDASSTGMERN